MIISRVKAATVLSVLTIDADKDWNSKNITNLGSGGYDVNSKLASIVTALSGLSIDADKDWNSKRIYNLLTGIPSGEYLLYDDWSDNLLTGRTATYTHYDFVTTSGGVKIPFVKETKTCPEWTTEAGSPSVSSGELVLSYGDKVSTSSTIITGTWEWVSRYNTTGGDMQMSWYFIYADANNSLAVEHDYTSHLSLYKFDAGSGTALISVSQSQPTTNTAYKITRDSSGNFELFYGGVSQGTATDTFLPPNYNKIYFANEATSTIIVYTVSFKVY